MHRLLLLLPALAACATTRPVPDAADARRSLLAADEAFAARAQAAPAAEAVVAMLADDALVLLPNQPVRRGAEAAAALRAMPNAAARLAWRPAYADVSADGTRGWTTGFATLEGAGVDTVRGRHAAYAAFWRREAGGTWRVEAYVRNPAPPPPAAIDAPSMPAAVYAARPGTAVSASVVLDADRAFAKQGAEQGPRAAFVAWVADDALAFSEKGFDHGPAVREGLRQAFQGDPRFEWGPVFGDVAPSGDLGVTVGEARITGTPPGGGAPRTTFSKYMTVWRRQADGAYRFVFDVGNPRPAS